ncbi:MAG: hypothetical protein ABW133_03310, partial [Polyangiaceae bacterium]
TASVRPWSVIANTESPAVIIPDNGADALEGALKHYRVQWLILSREDCAGTTQPVCAKIRDGAQTALGTLVLTRHQGAGDLHLFRIENRNGEAG